MNTPAPSLKSPPPRRPRRAMRLADAAATAALARALAPSVRRGDMICLRGALGAGKTTFARALIRAVGQDEALEVPSPTFTLVQTYATSRVRLYHVDLYRLDDFAATAELGIDDMLGDGVVVVEWPERLGGTLPAARLDLAIEETLSRETLSRETTSQETTSQGTTSRETTSQETLSQETAALGDERRVVLSGYGRWAGVLGRMDDIAAKRG